MYPRRYLGVAAALALVLLPAFPAFAQQAATANLSGTIQAIVPQTGTAAEEIVVSESSGVSVTYALTSQTAYSLMGAGLGANAPTITSANLAVGQQVEVTPSATPIAGVNDAASVAVDAQITMGQISSVSSGNGQGTSFDVVANGKTSAFSEAADAVVSGSASLAVGQDAVVYSVNEGGSSATAFVVDLNGAFPTFTGTVASANGSALTLMTESGSLNFAYTSATPVTVGQSAVSDAYLIPGAQVTVSYSVDPSGAIASAFSVAPATVSGTITNVSPSQGATDLAVSTASGPVTVAVLPSTGLGTATLSQFVSNASVTATGVLVGSTLTAVSLSLAPTQVTGTVASVPSSSSFVVSTANGSTAFLLSSATTVDVGSYPATSANIAVGEQVTVAYQSQTSNGTTVNTASSVTIAPQTLLGTVGAAPTATSFSVTTQGGSSVAVTLSPNAVVSGTIAQGDTVSLIGISLSSTSFEAFAVNSQASATQPGRTEQQMVVGRVSAVSSTSLILNGRDGQTYTVALSPTTVIRLGSMTANPSLLAVGEWARVRMSPSATTSGSPVALAVQLFPRTAIGVVEKVATSSTGTVLTLRGRMIGHIFPVGKGRGRGEQLPEKVVGNRMFKVTVPADVTVNTLGQASTTNATTTIQTGDAVAAQGALAGDGLVASQVAILPTSSSKMGHGKNDGHGHQGQDGNHGNHGNRENRGHQGTHGRKENFGKHGDQGTHGKGHGAHGGRGR